MSTIGSRLRYWRWDHLHLSREGFRDAIEKHRASDGKKRISTSTIAGYEKDVMPRADFLAALFGSWPDLNPDWLILGVGEMRRRDEAQVSARRLSSPELIELAREYFEANPEKRPLRGVDPFRSGYVRAVGYSERGVAVTLRGGETLQGGLESLGLLERVKASTDPGMEWRAQSALIDFVRDMGGEGSFRHQDDLPTELGAAIDDVLDVLKLSRRHPTFFAGPDDVAKSEWTTFVLSVVTAFRSLAWALRDPGRLARSRTTPDRGSEEVDE